MLSFLSDYYYKAVFSGVPFGSQFSWSIPTTHDVSIMLVPQHLTMVLQAGLLNGAYFFVWGEDLQD